MRRWFVCCSLLLTISQAYALEGQASLNWLKTAAFAGHQTEYSGIFVYQYGNRLETSKITHLIEADSEYERLESLDGPKREIVRHHGQVWCFLNHKMVQVDSQQGRGGFPSLLSDELSALNQNYIISDVGQGTVAGYNAQIVLFKPKDNLRYTHKLWVNTDTGLLLKATVLSERGQVVEQYAFTQLKIGGDLDRSSLVPSKAVTKVPADAPKVSVDKVAVYKSGWVADAIPLGFTKMTEVQRPMPGKHAPVTQIVYSDGLSAISVFIEPVDSDEDDVEGLSNRGALNMYHKVVGKQLYTVVGEVPPRTVMQVLDSIRYNGK